MANNYYGWMDGRTNIRGGGVLLSYNCNKMRLSRSKLAVKLGCFQLVCLEYLVHLEGVLGDIDE